MTTTTCSPLKNWMILATATVLGSGCLSPEEQCMKLAGGYGWADVAEIEAECRQFNGTDCDSTQFIEIDAAKCIASNAGLEDGIDGLHGNIAFDGGHETVVWYIYNRTSPGGGYTVEINATTGSILDEIMIGDI